MSRQSKLERHPSRRAAPVVHYTTGEAAELLGVSRQTLLRYEQEGIIPPARRNAVNNWRYYTQRDLTQIRKTLFP